MRALLLEVEHAGEHRPLGFVELAVRVRVHHQRPKLIRRVCRNFVLDHSVHTECPRHKARDGVDDYYERREDLADKSHDGHCVLPSSLRVLSGDCPRHQLADNYMKENSEREPGRPTHNAQPDGAERASYSGGSGRRGSPVLVLDRDVQRGFRGREDRTHHDEYDYPDQSGRKGASPAKVL